MRYGRLTLLEDEGKVREKHRCICDCGVEVFVRLSSLRNGGTKSCGCLQKQKTLGAVRKHGRTKTTEYTSWQLMKDRCLNKNNNTYSYYGGRGITVCDRWAASFELFFADMGCKPSSSHTIDRISPDGNYCKENCRWASKKEQARNRKNTKMVEFDGSIKPLAEWCEILNLDYSNTNKRLWRGWSAERAFKE